MPKIIENVKEQLLSEARRQIEERGYAQTTVRSVAGACGIAVGTVYNYFSSKDMLIASFVAADWLEAIQKLTEYPPRTAEEAIRSVYNLLRDFSEAHRALFTDRDAAKTFSAIFSERHKLLRDQLAVFFLPFCGRGDKKDSEFLSQFLSESVLTWAMAGVEVEKLTTVLQRIL